MQEKIKQTISLFFSNLDAFDIDLLSDYSSKNNLSILLHDHGFSIPKINQELSAFNIILTELKNLSLTLQEKNTKFVVIKFPYLSKLSSDIDILVINRTNLSTTLASIGYSIEDDSEPHRSTYVKKVNDVRVSIDVHHHLSWRRVVYVDSQSIIDQSKERFIDGVSIPYPATHHDLLITAAHSIFKHNKISLFDVLHTLYLQEIFEESSNEYLDLNSLAKNYHWNSEFKYYMDFVSSMKIHLNTPLTINSPILKLPYQFDLRTVVSIRFLKILRSFSFKKPSNTLIQIYAYSFDSVQFLVEENLGISMKLFFDFLTRIKKNTYSFFSHLNGKK